MGEKVSTQLNTAIVSFFDQDTGKILKSIQVQGATGQKIGLDVQAHCTDYQNKGYRLIANGLPAKAQYSSDDATQNYAIILGHQYLQINLRASEPPVLGELKIPQESYLRHFTRTVYFVTTKGAVVAKANQQSSTWTRSLTVDRVNGQITNPNTKWQSTTKNYEMVTAPVIKGYFADQKELAAEPVAFKNLTEKITYRPLGKIVPVDEEGNVLASPVQYHNDLHDPTKAAPREKTPVIAKYKTRQKEVIPANPGEDTIVHYQRDLRVAIINYIDKVTGKTLASDKVTGDVGTPINYNLQKKLDYYLNRGYQLVSNNFKDNSIYQGNQPQQFTITLAHQQQVLTAKDPQVTGKAINPADPNSPTWPSQELYTCKFSFTVNFINLNGQRLQKDQTQSSQWSRQIKVDKVTGKVVDLNAKWHSKIKNYHSIPIPVIEGYYTHRENISHPRAIPFNMRYTVVYYALGRVIPVDSNHQPLPDVAHPQYQNDPLNPTTASLKDSLPDVEGYRPDPVATITDLGKDTEVVYNRVNSQHHTAAINSEKAVAAQAGQTVEEQTDEQNITATQEERPSLKINFESLSAQSESQLLQDLQESLNLAGQAVQNVEHPSVTTEATPSDQAPMSRQAQRSAKSNAVTSEEGFWNQLTARFKKHSQDDSSDQ